MPRHSHPDLTTRLDVFQSEKRIRPLGEFDCSQAIAVPRGGQDRGALGVVSGSRLRDAIFGRLGSNHSVAKPERIALAALDGFQSQRDGLLL